MLIDPDTGDCVLDNQLTIPVEVFSKLYDYQKQGVAWMWGLRNHVDKNGKSGGLLGDDMGLGKTVQVSAFIESLFFSQQALKVLIIIPLSLFDHWIRTLQEWNESGALRRFHGPKTTRSKQLQEVVKLRCPVVMITTYETIRTNIDEISNSGINWDYVFLDEGHKIKDHNNLTSKAIWSIHSRFRIILTGTPLQNNFREYWSLFSYATHGQLFGSIHNFVVEFEQPITNAQDKDASEADRRLGDEKMKILYEKIQPHFLRREKKDVLGSSEKNNTTGTSTSPLSTLQVQTADSIVQALDSLSISKDTKSKSLPLKKDLVLWTKLSSEQIMLYNNFLESRHVKEVLREDKSALASLTVLKKICDHPLLLTDKWFQSCNEEDDEEQESTEDIVLGESLDLNENDPVHQVRISSKLTLLMRLLKYLYRMKNRTIIFSRSRKMLDLIQRSIGQEIPDCVFVRIDGLTNVKERQKIVDEFNESSRASVLLMTTQVGGLGFNATGADRVIIYDPSWNPTSDAQAVDRVYRIGQTKNVMIYRLVTCGTIEERIYQKQIYKGSLARSAVEGKVSHRGFFSRKELRDVFTLEDPNESATQRLLDQKLSTVIPPEELKEKEKPFKDEIDVLKTFPEVYNKTFHDLVFQNVKFDAQEFEKNRVENKKRNVKTNVSGWSYYDQQINNGSYGLGEKNIPGEKKKPRGRGIIIEDDQGNDVTENMVPAKLNKYADRNGRRSNKNSGSSSEKRTGHRFSTESNLSSDCDPEYIDFARNIIPVSYEFSSKKKSSKDRQKVDQGINTLEIRNDDAEPVHIEDCDPEVKELRYSTGSKVDSREKSDREGENLNVEDHAIEDDNAHLRGSGSNYSSDYDPDSIDFGNLCTPRKGKKEVNAKGFKYATSSEEESEEGQPTPNLIYDDSMIHDGQQNHDQFHSDNTAPEDEIIDLVSSDEEDEIQEIDMSRGNRAVCNSSSLGSSVKFDPNSVTTSKLKEEASKFKVLHPAKGLDRSQMTVYTTLVKGAREKALEGEWQECLELCLGALAICDEDKNLQVFTAMVSAHMGLVLKENLKNNTNGKINKKNRSHGFLNF